MNNPDQIVVILFDVHDIDTCIHMTDNAYTCIHYIKILAGDKIYVHQTRLKLTKYSLNYSTTIITDVVIVVQ